MDIDSFDKISFQYTTGQVPPPFCFRYVIDVSLVGKDKYGNLIHPYEADLNTIGWGIAAADLENPSKNMDVSINGNTINNIGEKRRVKH